MVPQHYFASGDTCGPYEIVRILGIGGYAQVYEARSPIHERVALKILRIRHSRDRRAMDRLFKEAKIIRSHNHVNIVSFVDWGIYGDDEFVYLAMELVVGATLSAILREGGAVTVERALKWGRQLCYALADVHRNNVVHRDIKPSNIMVVAGSNDLIKLLDFGVARDELGLGTTQAVGTPLYMSPDYLRNGPSQPDTRWDLYAVAMVLYECIAGAHPLVVRDEEQPSGAVFVRRQLTWEIRSLADAASACPSFVSDTIMKGLEKDPADCWASAKEFEAALADCAMQLAPTNTQTLRPLPRDTPIGNDDVTTRRGAADDT